MTNSRRLFTLGLALILAFFGLSSSAQGQLYPFKGKKRVAPSLDGGAGWINTDGPIDPAALRGKFVLLDFWTYCCINCMHILPELKKLEEAYPKNLVVIGVHSAKFPNEADTEHIREAVKRYGIAHPVINDNRQILWNKYEVDSWPSLRLIDPEGNWVDSASGEVTFEKLNDVLKHSLAYYKKLGVLNATPLVFDHERRIEVDHPLRYPGKILADAAADRLFIADSGHNRIVVTKLDGALVETIGSGALGAEDGGFAEAEFDHPQGMALVGTTLFVADTENHKIRACDLTAKTVKTIAGTGRQRRNPTQFASPKSRFVGSPEKIPLNSPWSLLADDKYLYIAMAGAHQIWRMTLDGKRMELHAGSGKEDIVDGGQISNGGTTSCFAQPSGLASDGERMFVADSEGSSIRSVPFASDKPVSTIVGTPHLRPEARLFTNGDQDGVQPNVLLQHPLDVAFWQGKVLIADSYNHKIKVLDPANRAVLTFLAGRPDAKRLGEPGGLAVANDTLFIADTNNHSILAIDLPNAMAAKELAIPGLTPPRPPAPKPSFKDHIRHKISKPVKVAPRDGNLTFNIELRLPPGEKLNDKIPLDLWLQAEEKTGPISRASLDKRQAIPATDGPIVVTIPVEGAEGDDSLALALTFYYCSSRGQTGVCKIANVLWLVDLKVSEDGSTDPISLEHQVK